MKAVRLDQNHVLTLKSEKNASKAFSLARFQWQNRRFLLKNPASCTLDFQDGLWVYECPRYGMHTFSTNRHEAFAKFNEEFAFLYDGLYNQPDDALTLDAIQLRDVLRNDLEKVVVED
ncbi:MAG: hypothetical protein ABSE73_32050 [Planctomycetota bacterium]